MARVTIKGASFQRVYREAIAGKLFIDLTSEGSGPNKGLNRTYGKHIKKVTERVANLVARAVDKDVRKEYNAGISAVQKYLKTGIEGVPDGITLGAPVSHQSWSALGKKYYNRKPSATRNNFWVRRSAKGLSGRFGAFAGTHKGAVTNTSTVVNFNEEGKRVFSNKVFRYSLVFTLPTPHKGEGYFKKLLQDSFFNGEAHVGYGHGLDGGLEVLGYIEGLPRKKPNKHRPFIAELMASRGRAFLEITNRRLKTQVI